MKTLNIPKTLHISTTRRDFISLDGEYVEELRSPGNQISIVGDDYEQSVDSGKLILDAFEVYNQHNLIPSQLISQIEKLQQEKEELLQYIKSITIITRSFRDYDPKTIGYEAYIEHAKLIEKYKEK